MAGRSGIGVLVTGFSRVGALKKHAPLVFNVHILYTRNLQHLCTSEVSMWNIYIYIYIYLILNKVAKKQYLVEDNDVME